jgi:MFS family permease
MNQLHLLAVLINAAVIAAFAASVLFIATYTALASWWRSEIGRALVMLDAGLSLTLGPIVFHHLFGVNVSSPAFAWYDLGSITLVALATLWRTWIVAKTQWRERRRRKPGSDEPGADAVMVPPGRPA